MRLHGVVRGSSISLRESPRLPDGQAVEVEIVTTESAVPSIEELRKFRARLLDRWGRPKDFSTEMVREDRER